MDQRRETMRRAVAGVADPPETRNPEIAALLRVLPVTAAIARADCDIYRRLRERYALEGPSRELADEALAAANDLGAALQGLRRRQVWLTGMAQARREEISQLAPPMYLLDVIHGNLLLLTDDGPDTLAAMISSENLDGLLDAAEVRAWFRAVAEWLDAHRDA